MKFRTTQKEIRTGYVHVLKVGYCELQYLLSYESPVAYTTRREGWGCDVYDIGNGNAISTGYAPFGDITVSYDLCRKYEDLAYGKDRETRAKLIKELVNECLSES